MLEDSKTLGDCGFTSQTARPQAPATVGLAFRVNGTNFNFSKDQIISVSCFSTTTFWVGDNICKGVSRMSCIDCRGSQFPYLSCRLVTKVYSGGLNSKRGGSLHGRYKAGRDASNVGSEIMCMAQDSVLLFIAEK